jgi:hypothetical protein
LTGIPPRNRSNPNPFLPEAATWPAKPNLTTEFSMSSGILPIAARLSEKETFPMEHNHKLSTGNAGSNTTQNARSSSFIIGGLFVVALFLMLLHA